MKAIRVISFLAAWAVCVYAVGLLIGLVWGPPTVATCEGKVMTSIDKCGTSLNGGTPTGFEGPSEHLQSQQVDHYLWLYLIAFAIVTAVVIVTAVQYQQIFIKWMGEPKPKEPKTDS